MEQIKLRYQKVSDAERFYEILTELNSEFFDARPGSVEDERRFLEEGIEHRINNFEINYAIIFKGKLVGGCGFKIDQHRPYIGEIGYFVDRNFWGNGLATAAVKKLEQIGFNEMNLKKIIMYIDINNIGSNKVAEKCGFEIEGTVKNVLKCFRKFETTYLYAKNI